MRAQSGQLRGEGGGGPAPRAEDQDPPLVAPQQSPAPKGRHCSGPYEGTLAGPRRTEYRQKPASSELLQHPGRVVLPPHEELGMGLVERLKPAIGAGSVRLNVWKHPGRTGDRADKVLERRRGEAVTKINPRPCAEKCELGISEIGRTREQDHEYAKGAILSRAIGCDRQLLSHPASEPMVTHEDRAGLRRVQSLEYLWLPTLPRSAIPGIDPWLEIGSQKPGRNSRCHLDVSAVVREENIEAGPCRLIRAQSGGFARPFARG